MKIFDSPKTKWVIIWSIIMSIFRRISEIILRKTLKFIFMKPLDLSGTIKIVRSKIVILFIWGELFIIVFY